MKLPGFGGECSLGASRRVYRVFRTGAAGEFDGVVPAAVDDSDVEVGIDDDADIDAETEAEDEESAVEVID